MPTGVWIFLGLVVLGFLISRSMGSGKPAGPSEKSDLGKKYDQKDILAVELAKEWAAKAMALPIVDQDTSWLFHEPNYDAKVDMFDPPCRDQDFSFESGRCWKTRDKLAEVFAIWADHEAGFQLGLSRPRTGAVIPAGDYIDIVNCLQSVNEPGLRIVRVSRVAEDRWHTQVWTCGLAPGAGDVGLAVGNMRVHFSSDSSQVDPPLLATDVAQDPSLWTRRNALVRERWKSNGDWRDAAALCEHRT